MLKWLTSEPARTQAFTAFANATDGLASLYKEKLLPLEQSHAFHEFYSAQLTDADFTSRPMVLLVGQYSTGKSSFIRHLLGRDYPGLRIGPEPTTDKFVVVSHGDRDQVTPGNAAVVDPSMPFSQLAHMGNAFLNRFECARLPCPILEGITLVDTPGVLSGEKQRLNRGYQFEEVIKWFSDRVDMILLLFDVSKMDISDEFRAVVLALKGNDSKIHLMLNKADTITTSQLMRVYGAMMWNLGKVIDTPEVSRVYIGSFWDDALANDEQRRLFESEENDLYTNLACIPQTATFRKLNDLIKRARLSRVHAHLSEHLKKKLPSHFGKDREKKRLLSDLGTVFEEVADKHGLALGDFPDEQFMRDKLAKYDWDRFKKADKKHLEWVDMALNLDFPKLLTMIPDETEKLVHSESIAMGVVGSTASPFAVIKVGGATEASVFRATWLVAPDPEDYREEFVALGPNSVGKLLGQRAKAKMVESKLPSNALHKIWSLADVDKDGALTLNEYALAMHFIKMKLDGQDLPIKLPPQMMPSQLTGAQSTKNSSHEEDAAIGLVVTTRACEILQL
mmetsp:Transcript_97600/g.188189  ORF Transcript_97600/g.188189 Transcript_97600/m.188189 type:complete len:564 (-) Transcript_97600:15-1706(-)